MKYFNDGAASYTTARFFGIKRSAKDGAHWGVQVLEREYANVKPGDDDFFKDDNGFNFTVGEEDLAGEFDVLDAATLQPTGAKCSVGRLFVLVQSLYVARAVERDAASAKAAAGAAARQPDAPA